MFVNAVLSAFVNLLLLAGLPFLVYYGYHRRRHQRTFTEIARRAGIQLGKQGYLGYCWLFSFIAAATLIFFPPSLEASVREGSAFQPFEGPSLEKHLLKVIAHEVVFGSCSILDELLCSTACGIFKRSPWGRRQLERYPEHAKQIVKQWSTSRCPADGSYFADFVRTRLKRLGIEIAE